MNLHSCKVRLQGEVKDEVQKTDCTSAEIRVLKEIHGDDAVLEVKVTGNTDRSDNDERLRLGQLYGEKTVTAMFGAPVATINDEIEAEVEVEAPSPAPLPVAVRTKTVKPQTDISALTE